MKILIVDDQTSVVNGLVKGITWDGIGIQEVYPAYNAYEAKQILLNKDIDILICDIEMPRENGLVLLKWIRDQGMDVECIFLTAHAQFDYAQEAIKMGSFDYILQPAPYENIKAAVCKAIHKVIEKQNQKEKSLYGELYLSQKEIIKDKVITDMIEGRMTDEKYQSFYQAGNLPQWNQKCYQALIQIFHMDISINQFGEELLHFVILNVGTELFSSYEQEIILTVRENMNYLLTIYGENNYLMDYFGVIRQLEMMKMVLEKYLNGRMAIYVGEAVTPSGIREQFNQLNNMKTENLAFNNQIFLINEEKGNHKARFSDYHLPQLDRWIKYLKQNLCNTVRTEAYDYLNQLAEQKKLTQDMLMLFHMDMIRMLYAILEDNHVEPQEIFAKYHSKEIYLKATQSLKNMKVFVDSIIRIAEDGQKNYYESFDKVDTIKRYINENIEKNIKRSDIAEYLHMNVDYLNRVFKKQTGMALSEYIIMEKLNAARQLIKTTMLPISFIAARAGFSNFSHFSKAYKKVFDISPSEERKENKAD
ncbi:MAG: response regulator [Anaerocolumna sp.]|nr:response regulator [Anaerocolumna sp.]